MRAAPATQRRGRLSLGFGRLRVDAVDHVVNVIVGDAEARGRGTFVVALERRISLGPAGCQLHLRAALVRAANVYHGRRQIRVRIRHRRDFRIRIDHARNHCRLTGNMRVQWTPCSWNGTICTYAGQGTNPAGSTRSSGSTLHVELQYDVSNLLFLPTTFRFGSL